MTCPTSFVCGEKPQISSINPKPNTTVAHANSGKYCKDKIEAGMNRSVAIKVNEKAANMATPPMRGVGLVCHRSARGSATCPLRIAKRRTNGVRAVDKPKARMNVIIK